MSAPIPLFEQKWRALIEASLKHAREPGRAPAPLLRVIRALKGVQTPGDTRLWAALKYLAVYYGEGDLPRRLALAPLLSGLALYCQDLLDPPAPKPAAAVGDRVLWFQQD